MSNITDEEARIDRRQEIIRARVVSVFDDPGYQTRREESIRAKGGSMHLRMLSFVRLALHDRGAWLLSHWREIKKELDIPWAAHYHNAAAGSWGSADLESYFHRTAVAAAGELYEGQWVALRLPGPTGYQLVSQEELWSFLYPLGQHPHLDHPPLQFTGRTIDLSAGAIYVANLANDLAHASRPVFFEAVSTLPEWAVLLAAGRLTLTGVPAGDHRFKIRVIDAEEEEAHADFIFTATTPE